MEKTIAFFDFDGTITKKDSMIEFIRYAKGDASLLKGFITLLPALIKLKLGIMEAGPAKEQMISYFFKGMKLNEFNALCKNFSKERLPHIIKADALRAINEHKHQGHEVVVVSASAENWISYWCTENGIGYTGTRLQVDDEGRLTGKIDGVNCNGVEKVNRIKLSYDPAKYKNIYCYGDTSGDTGMLELATHRYYRHFKK